MRFSRPIFRSRHHRFHPRHIDSGVIAISPPVLLLLGFGALSLFGTGLLWWPLAAHEPLSLWQALFTATSAITVTGLSVIPTSELTLWGQVVVLGLIQLGGIGFMTFAALTLSLLGIRLPLYQRNLVKESLNHTSFAELKQLVQLVVRVSLVAELTGAAFLALVWVPEYGWGQGLWASFFHAVSAFNNAGFSLWPDSLMRSVDQGLVNAVIIVLFVMGGLGFTVIGELMEWRPGKSLSLNTRIVLRATLWLALLGFVAMLLLEWQNPRTLGSLPSISARLQAALFQSLTPRTAGFNTLDTGQLSDPMSLVTMFLMFIGGGSGSTASGIKLTTFVVLLMVARAFLRGQAQPHLMGRALAQDTVMKAVSVALAGIALIFTCLFVLTITEPGKHFLDLAFETVSAFATVGLSRGITGDLSHGGQLVLVVTMLLGRVGPLSIGYFLAARREQAIRYPRGSVPIG
ncbi:Ktr system potassium transporter B [Terasakiispira papahanaumokuakeensis]|uniref:Ktr system potassium transporter B n=2 Tax=Terasakiispira papahanaumokuakeensis TaxID=197479 RepID=A0A1E2VBQ4_9GAMM|nr:Ktr system potassium transporter B [Terasakiispira papahanaumokuakeensis]